MDADSSVTDRHPSNSTNPTNKTNFYPDSFQLGEMAEINIEERIEELLSNCRILEEQINEAKIDAGTNTEKELLVRQLTSKKEEASTELT